jgi:hypothetical protein
VCGASKSASPERPTHGTRKNRVRSRQGGHDDGRGDGGGRRRGSDVPVGAALLRAGRRYAGRDVVPEPRAPLRAAPHHRLPPLRSPLRRDLLCDALGGARFSPTDVAAFYAAGLSRPSLFSVALRLPAQVTVPFRLVRSSQNPVRSTLKETGDVRPPAPWAERWRSRS